MAALTREAAEALGQQALDDLGRAGEFMIVPEHTTEHEFGWVLHGESRRFVETGDPRHKVPGIGPIVVDRTTGEVSFLPTNRPPDQLIGQFLQLWRDKNAP